MFELYDLTGKKKYRKAIDLVYSQIEQMPRTKEGKQFFVASERMKDPKTGLYYHAYDASREMFWCDKVTGLSQNFCLTHC